MRAVILAAGKGTRMKDLTKEIPKPMLHVQGRPILEHILEGLVGAGIRHICIITGWHAEAIESYFGTGQRWGIKIEYARQMVQDGTGKAPELAKNAINGDDFLLTYGDILVRPETYQQMLGRWKESPFDGLITATPSQDVNKGGILFFDPQFHLTRLVEKHSLQQLDELRTRGWIREGQPVWYNAGIYLFRPSLFDFTAQLQKSPRGEYELTDAIEAMLRAGCQIAGLEIAGRWVDVRDPEVLASLQS
jgi:dTDP-glucose pyrophosphorylase